MISSQLIYLRYTFNQLIITLLIDYLKVNNELYKSERFWIYNNILHSLFTWSHLHSYIFLCTVFSNIVDIGMRRNEMKFQIPFDSECIIILSNILVENWIDNNFIKLHSLCLDWWKSFEHFQNRKIMLDSGCCINFRYFKMPFWKTKVRLLLLLLQSPRHMRLSSWMSCLAKCAHSFVTL